MMQATNFLPCKAPLYGKSSQRRIPIQRKRVPVIRARRAPDDGDYAGSIVDENMIVLRTRIHNLTISEQGHQRAPVSDSQWMDWEEDYYELSHNQRDGYGVIGFLQAWMMRVRPGSVLGLVAILSMSAGILAAWLFIVAMGFVHVSSS